MSLGRRSFLALAGATSAGLGLTGCAGTGQTGQQLVSRAPLPPTFSVPLPRPPHATPVATSGDADVYRIEARSVDAELLPGLRTPLLAYDGVFPGPTLETRRGRAVRVEHVNSLPVPMVVHLHGGVVPSASDGFPTDLVLPAASTPARRVTATDDHPPRTAVTDPAAVVTSGSRTYEYPNDQRAAMLWYHDHRMDFTGPMVYRGLAGTHLVRDDEEDALPLPRGNRELVLMVADRAFEEDGALRYPSLDPTLTTTPGVRDFAMEGVLGDVVLVNGAPWPYAEVDAARHRLRILNASNARRYRLRLDPPPPDGSGVVQIGSDGGLLANPRQLDGVTLAPAERADVLVDFGAYPVGTKVVLRNDLGVRGTDVVMRFDVVRGGRDDTAVPPVLSRIEPLRTEDAVVTREFRFMRGQLGDHSGWLVNGLPFDPTRMDATVPSGRLERWRFRTDTHHPVHVHLAHFQVASRGGRPPLPGDAGWKDTVDVRPADTVDVLLRFPDLPGRYVLHCHNLEHEDMMMMSAFGVV